MVISPGLTVFTDSPGVLLVTQTSRVHVAPAAKVFRSRLIVVAPDGAVRVRLDAGPQPAEKFGPVELLTVIPGGRVSVIEKLVRGISAGAVMASRKRVLPPTPIGLVWNDLVKPTGIVSLTVIWLEFVFPLLIPGIPVTEPGGILFVYEPTVDDVTCAVMVHVPGVMVVPGGTTTPAGMVALESVSWVSAGLMDTVAGAQVAETAADPNTNVNPTGKVSNNPTPV